MAIVKDQIQTFDSTLGAWIEHAANEAPNRNLLQLRLDSINGQDQLLCFLRRFLLFNDALAARLAFLAGLIHLTPELFLDKESEEAFCPGQWTNCGFRRHSGQRRIPHHF